MPMESSAGRWPALTWNVINLGHPIAFCWLAHLAFVGQRERFPYPSVAPHWRVLVAAAVFAIATEIAQAFVGRDPSALDVMNDLLGSGAALLLHARVETRHRHVFTGLVVLAGIVVAAPPVTTAAAYLVRSIDAPVIWRSDSLLFRQLGDWQTDSPPTLVVRDLPSDWRGWKALEIVLQNLRAEPQTVYVDIRDRHHKPMGLDRYVRGFSLAPQSRTTLRISMDEIRRIPGNRMTDLAAIRWMMIFGEPGATKRTFNVLEIRLAR